MFRPEPNYRGRISTFVLVHGAMHGGWCWRDVRNILADDGHCVFTPTLTGQGDRRSSISPEVGVETHLHDLEELLWFEDLTDVHLVLHSYAGILAGPMAARHTDRLASITLLGGFITANGECLLDVEPESVRNRYRERSAQQGSGWLLPADTSFLTQWGITDPALAAWVGPRLTSFPVRCQTEPTTYDPAALSHIPTRYVHHTAPPLDSLDFSLERAQASGWEVYEIECGHDMMLERPSTIAGLLADLAHRH